METATVNQWSSCLVGAGVAASTFPMVPSATLAKLNEAKNLPDFGLTGAGSFRITCKMPLITTQASGTGWGEYVKAYGSSTWTATVKASNFAIRKNQP